MEIKQRGFMRTFVARSFDSSLLLFLLLLEGNVFLVELFLILLGCLHRNTSYNRPAPEGGAVYLERLRLTALPAGHGLC